MVFAHLQDHEKDAFFSLLDEYFSSRPDIFANVGGPSSSSSSSGNAAASAVHRALASNPEATSKLFSAGLKHAGGLPKSSQYAAAASDPEVNTAAGRVAAASLAFSGSGSGSRNNNNTVAPPTPTHRTLSGGASPPPIAEKPSSPGLVSVRKFGDVDTSSAKNMFGSLRSSTANKNAVHPPPAAPPAFAARANQYGPPPVRHVLASGGGGLPTPPQRHQSPPEARQEEEEEEEREGEGQGEWAEALYDYDSQDAGDLNIRANQRVLVTERTSDDWWTGEYNGRKGLFPASYVKVL